jgi:hypothetical protein
MKFFKFSIWVWLSGLIAFLALGALVFYTRPNVKKRNKVEKKLASIYRQLKKFEKNPPVESKIENLKKQIVVLKGKSSIQTKILGLYRKWPFEWQRDVLDPGRYYIERLHKTRDIIKEKAGEATDIDSLEKEFFNKGKISDNKRVLWLLEQLEIVKEILNTAIDTGVKEIREVKVEKETNKSNKEKLPTGGILDKRDLKIIIKGEIESLINFLYQLSEDSRYFAVKEILINSSVAAGRGSSGRGKRTKRNDVSGMLEMTVSVHNRYLGDSPEN